MAHQYAPGSTSDEYFDRHRFDNYTAWLDMEDRKKNRGQGKHLGFGYGVPKPPQPPRPERPFYVQEFSMTSGILVNRKYDATETNFRAEKMRSDPHHFPNYIDVKDSDHYKDHRRRNCHCDPDRWTIDPVLRDAVSEEQVKQTVAANRGMTRTYPDPKILDILFSDSVKPKKETFKELNVDLSCLDLPVQEGGLIRDRAKKTTKTDFMPAFKPPEDEVAKMNENAWQWCTGGRKMLDDSRAPPSPEKMTMLRSQSLPQALAGASLLPGSDGAPASPFHGMATRKFGQSAGWDGRMRGAKLARNRWAGTFPEKEARFTAFAAN
eukprot:gb/GFBE01053182.1/.p1 GENE.gb/GFBE01053182.1/~~gb/GFBE01053182.1/.p1  ORF type:complete len:322 (+),score=70.75 gb/GFBE01053182.1/:1-966(+)